MKTSFCILTVFLVFSFISCREHKTNKQIFEENLDKYVEACIHPFIQKGVDTTSSRNFCRCILKKTYEIDSTFFVENFFVENKVCVEDILDKHTSEIIKECDLFIKQYLSPEGKWIK